MRDKRPVDELSVEELERVLAIKRREERQQHLQRMQRTGRVIETVAAFGDPEPDELPVEAPAPPVERTVPAPDPVAAALAALTQPIPPLSTAETAPGDTAFRRSRRPHRCQ